jgi:hypothetical protein
MSLKARILSVLLTAVCHSLAFSLSLSAVTVAVQFPAAAVAAPAAQQNAVNPEVLSKELSVRMDRVPEFKFIRETAEKLGVKVYLFGGTASGYAHYVRWDLLREAGDKRYQPNRFDYDFTNIYRSNQDLDIVVDGTKEQIESVAHALRSRYPHFQGTKEAWEVRSLRESLGETKMALLNDKDFLTQNSDSNSTGLIELTRSGEPPVRDLFHWETELSPFLKDIAEGKIHYYRNPNHYSSKRAKAGKNPEILSVLRYLVKAVQFELEMRPQDVSTIKSITSNLSSAILIREKQAMTATLKRKLKRLEKSLS